MTNTEADLNLIRSDLTGMILGRVLGPGDPGYSDLLSIDNGRVSLRPFLVVRPTNTDDVSKIVAYCHDRRVPMTTKAGGHSAAGYCLNSEGVVLDLGDINQIQLLNEDGKELKDPTRVEEGTVLSVGAGTRWISAYDFSPGTDVTDAVANGQFGKKLLDFLREELTRQVLLHFECEQDPQPENRVTIDPKYKDRLGNYRPVIHYNASEYVKKAFEAAKLISDQIFKNNGILEKDTRTEYTSDDPDYWEYKGKPYTSRGAGHIVGTHRMGSDRNDSVVDADMRTWDHENLFLAGCGNMPTLGTSNPTLTMTALVFKSAEAILRQLGA